MIRDGFPKEKEKETKAKEISQRKRERRENPLLVTACYDNNGVLGVVT